MLHPLDSECIFQILIQFDFLVDFEQDLVEYLDCYYKLKNGVKVL